ncbi:MAG: prolyl oligopeptidase family serine peptidase [Solobacterium sp.]|nr:prolyl oligopeptidase family serine peptidase [Solobacterium sp.]
MGKYSLIQKVYGWGSSYSHVVLIGEKDLEIPPNYRVYVKRYDKNHNLIEEGERRVLATYRSDEKGYKDMLGESGTLEVDINANLSIASPYYNDPTIWNDGGGGFLKSWCITEYTIENLKTKQTWTELESVYHPDEELLDTASFDLDGIHVPYAYYEPETKNKTPLIVWLHGVGSGGNDIGFVTGGMQTTNFVTPEIQTIFNQAYILMPQSTTAWLDDGSGKYTTDGTSAYTKAVLALIHQFIDSHPQIDTNRIYLGGCSNGGFMTLNLLLHEPNLFAAAFPVCEAYKDKWLSEEDIKTLAKIPLWFSHNSDDPVVPYEETALPTYKRLKEAGSKDLHMSVYEKVIDPDFGNEYLGHFTWVYTLKNMPTLDFDGSPVKVNGKETTLYGWLASHRKKA